MGKRLLTLNVEDKNLIKSTASKNVESKKSLSEKETEKFGIVEINNKQAKSKLKNTKDLGFELNTTSQKQRNVKASVSKVDDYFDFEFKKPSKKVAQKSNNVEVLNEKSDSETTVIRADVDQNRCLNVTAEVSERVIDASAEKIISIARMGALFDCEIRMSHQA